jgi:hypothetical protein
MLDYQELLGQYSEKNTANEVEYAKTWLEQASHNEDLVQLAVIGGLLADRLAWVFVAGYQSALRHTFAGIPVDGLSAFAVSEDRKGDPPLPGVSSHHHDGQLHVSGYKTWVACSRSLAYLIIKADRGEEARYYCLQRHVTGLTLQDKYGNFLSEMSQGIAELDGVAVPEALDHSAVSWFGIRETLYIYMAFCAWAGKRGASLAACQGLINRLAALAAQPPADANRLEELKAVDAAVQELRVALTVENDEQWQADQRLIAMYSPGIQKRHI